MQETFDPRFDRTSSVFNSFKYDKGRNGFFFNGSLIGACYDSKRHKAIVAQDRITQKTCELMVCRYAHCPRWVSPRVPSLKESLLRYVIPRSVDNGCMIELTDHSSEIVKLRPITKARQIAEETKARQIAEETKARQIAEVFLSYTRLGLRSPIVERNNQS